jgi:Fe-S cluster biogenesis protein NfuA
MSEALPSDLPRVDQPVSIRAEVSLADPDTCKFTVSRPLQLGKPLFFASMAKAAASPLGERLFALGGVASVLIAENVVTLCKAPEAPWTGLKAATGMAIRAHLHSGQSAGMAMAGRSDAELALVIEELLEREINQSIAAHGGKISLVAVREGKAFIAMSGGCQGCASSQVTLQQGFEAQVRRVAPEITAIVDTTNHAAGQQPFYPRARPGESQQDI